MSKKILLSLVALAICASYPASSTDSSNGKYLDPEDKFTLNDLGEGQIISPELTGRE